MPLYSFVFPSGTAAAPGVRVGSEQSGLYASAGLLGLTVAGASKVTIGSDHMTTASGVVLNIYSANAGLSANADRLLLRAEGAAMLFLSAPEIVTGAAVAIGWTPTGAFDFADTKMYRDGAAGAIGLRVGAAAQILRGYYSWTDASNYHRWALQTGADYVELAAETAGTGADNLDLRLTPAGTGNVRFGTHDNVGIELTTGYITIKDAGGTLRKIAVIS